MTREVRVPNINPIISGDVVLPNGSVIRAGRPVVAREIIHENDFGMLVVRDTDNKGGKQDLVTYGPGKITAVMVLPIFPNGDIMLVNGDQYGLGKNTLEAPGARIKDGQTDVQAMEALLPPWGITLSRVIQRGDRDETSSRQYNVTRTLEAEVDTVEHEADHLRRGTSAKWRLPLGHAVMMVDRGEISNGLTGHLIFQAALARDINPLARKS